MARKSGKKFSDLQRDGILGQVISLDARGYNQNEIAEAIGVSQPQVSQYMVQIRAKYHTASAAHREEWVQQKVDQYKEVLREAFQAWENSKRAIRKVPGKDGSIRTIEIEVNPDAQYLRVALDSLRAVRNLLGLDAPTSVKLDAKINVQPVWDVIELPAPGTPVLDEIEAEIAKVIADPTYQPKTVSCLESQSIHHPSIGNALNGNGNGQGNGNGNGQDH